MRSPKNFTYDFSGFHPYIFVNGIEEDVKLLMDDLSAEGVVVAYYYSSDRRAYNGRLYDFYLKLAYDDGTFPDRQIVNEVLTNWLKTKNLKRKSPSDENRIIVELKVDDLIDQVEPVTDEIRELREDIQMLKRENRQLLNEVNALEEQVESLQVQLTTASQLSREKDILREAFLKFEQADGELRSAREELKRARVDSSARLADVMREMGNLKRDIYTAIFPDLIFIGGTLDILANELPRSLYAYTLGVLLASQLGDSFIIERALKGRSLKSLQGAPGWRELHLGKRYRFYLLESRKLVFIGHKNKQEKDIRNILKRY